MRTLKFHIPYRAAGRPVTYRIARVAVDVAEIDAAAAPVTVVQHVSRGERDIEYRHHDGTLWISSKASELRGGRISPSVFEAENELTAVIHRNTGHTLDTGRNPFLTDALYLNHVGAGRHRFIVDDEEMSEAFLASTMWQHVGRVAARMAIIGGIFHERSIGPVLSFVGQRLGEGRNELIWSHGTRRSIGRYGTMTFGMTDVEDAVRLAGALSGKQVTISEVNSPRRVGEGTVPEVDTLNHAIEALSTEIIAGWARRDIGTMRPDILGLVTSLRSALEARFPQSDLDFSSAYAKDLPRELWEEAPDAGDLLAILRKFRDYPKQIVSDYHMAALAGLEIRIADREKAPSEDLDAIGASFG